MAPQGLSCIETGRWVLLYASICLSLAEGQAGVSFPGSGKVAPVVKGVSSAAAPAAEGRTPLMVRGPSGAPRTFATYPLTLIAVLEFCHIEIILGVGRKKPKDIYCSVIYGKTF